MKRKRSTTILPRKFEPAVPVNVKFKLPTNLNNPFALALLEMEWIYDYP
jgi:hypothetical protein